MIDINAKKENCLARDKEFLSIYNDAFNFMIENRVPDPHNRALEISFLIKNLFWFFVQNYLTQIGH